MNNFQNELQMLNIGDFQATEAVPWDLNQYYIDQTRRCGCGGGFRCGGCGGGFRCGGCGGCFRCGGCGGGFRCGGCFGCFLGLGFSCFFGFGF
jgi:heterocycloanthracin/sonorensin family bacteriocin